MGCLEDMRKGSQRRHASAEPALNIVNYNVARVTRHCRLQARGAGDRKSWGGESGKEPAGRNRKNFLGKA